MPTLKIFDEQLLKLKMGSHYNQQSFKLLLNRYIFDFK